MQNMKTSYCAALTRTIHSSISIVSIYRFVKQEFERHLYQVPLIFVCLQVRFFFKTLLYLDSSSFSTYQNSYKMRHCYQPATFLLLELCLFLQYWHVRKTIHHRNNTKLLYFDNDSPLINVCSISFDISSPATYVIDEPSFSLLQHNQRLLRAFSLKFKILFCRIIIRTAGCRSFLK